MKMSIFITVLSVCGFSVIVHAEELNSNLGSVTGGDMKKAHGIIDTKCTACHSKDKIDLALSSGKDMNEIQKDMEKRGAKLSTNDREVLGIFWKQSKVLKKY
jgi:uncharacterized membrane protein